MPKIMSVGPTAAVGEAVMDAIMNGRKARKYIRIIAFVMKYTFLL